MARSYAGRTIGGNLQLNIHKVFDKIDILL